MKAVGYATNLPYLCHGGNDQWRKGSAPKRRNACRLGLALALGLGLVLSVKC